MKPQRRRCCIVVVHALVVLLYGAAHAEQTALDRYVAAPDPAYAYKLVNTIPGDAQTTFVLEMTSQSWLTPNEVNRTVWKHWLIIVKPQSVKTSKAMLFISGGSNDRPAPQSADAKLVRIATATNSVVAELKMVPNQPLTFVGEDKPRSEDGLIAYTWDKFLRSGEEKWPARLPMTKSAVRAMDTVSSFCAGTEAGGIKIDQFVVSGASKRGWTTWTTASVDKRVIAIIPIVIDALNIEPSMIHHYRAYGFWAPAVGDYVAMKIMDWTGTPQFHSLMKIEEPFEYRDRLTMPKFIINASGDQFFLPDSSQFYFKELKGIKYLRYVPNADHSLKGSDAAESMLACYRAVISDAALPQFSWTSEKDGSIRVSAKDRPAEVKLWQANNPKARDFRLETLGPVWHSTVLAARDDGTYVGNAAQPAEGWSAYFVELTYPNGGPVPFKFTTDVHVLPDVLPHEYQKRAAN